ncbi:hypothetical protein DL771_001444 [Monosporascus sp. 5C6A]|nr:hypothetical protein DL771_001444 [Monosporascus sp. 5C6A]
MSDIGSVSGESNDEEIHVQKGPAMSEEELTRWADDMLSGMARIMTSRSSATEIKNWSHRLEGLGPSIFNGLDEKEEGGESKTVRWSLIAHLHKDKDGSSGDEVAATKETIAWVVPGKQAKLPRKPNRLHFAIEVAYDLAFLATSVEEEVYKDYTETARGLIAYNSELPERIILNSLRLRRFIDYEFCDGGLPWVARGPFQILRPYKMLSYLGDKIKKRIADFEKARRAVWTATEDEYMRLYKDNPVEDEAEMGHQRESQMTLAQLTAFILDFRCLERVMTVFSRPEFILPDKMGAHVSFSNLWFLFPVGSLTYLRDPNVPQKVWRVIQRTGGRRYMSRPDHIPVGQYENSFSDFVIDCYHLDYDGTRYVPTFRRFRISSFEGGQSFLSLPVVPFEYVEREGIVNREDVLERAKQFKDLIKVRHQSYSGRSYDRTPSGKRLSELDIGSHRSVTRYSERIDSEVMVDFERALLEIPSWRPGDREFEPYQMDKSERGSDCVDPGERWDKRFTDDFMDVETRKWKEWEKAGTGPTEEKDLLLLPDRVFAFVLRTRSWACLQIGKDKHGNQRLTQVQPQEEPWEDLELPPGHKEIVQSLIDSHFSKDKSKNIHFDLVKGKECAAQSYGRPLLPITCGDLGLTPTDVESRLQEIFRLAQAWDCVMLLDEADIFLAQRTPTDTERNALVSVFLRIMEYYEGILFLTTNRVGVFDEAFKSRIHLSLYYPALSKEQTIRIWRSHIATAKKDSRIQVDEVDLVLCADEIFQRQSDPQFGPVWNGRQIRNAFQTAVALAGFHSKDSQTIKLERKYFNQVFSVSDQFSSYVWLVKQRNSEAQWNAMQMLRRDDWVYPGAPGEATINPQLVAPTNQAGQIPRPGTFPQSSYGQQPAIARPTAPFGGGIGANMNMMGSQFGNMLGVHTGSGQQWHGNAANNRVSARQDSTFQPSTQLQSQPHAAGLGVKQEQQIYPGQNQLNKQLAVQQTTMNSTMQQMGFTNMVGQYGQQQALPSSPAPSPGQQFPQQSQ